MVKENSKAPIIHIPNFAASKTGLSIVWANENKFATFASPYNNEKCRGINKLEEFSSLVTELKPDILIFDPLLRKLINESSGLFLSATGSKKFDSCDNFQANQQIKLSRKYRSVLRECIENIQEENARSTSETQRQHFNQCIALLYNLEFIWHLTEVLYIDSVPDDAALPHLSQWIRYHYPESERNARKILEAIKGKDCPSEYTTIWNNGIENIFPEYWNTVTGLIIQGNMELSRILLQLHSQSDSDAFTIADKILRTMPIYNIHGELSLSEFNLQWKFWKTDATKKLNLKLFDQYPELKFIIQLVSGDLSSCIDKLKNYTNSWYEIMVAVLLYTEPAIKFYELSCHAHRYVSQYGGSASLNFCDATVLALFESDLLSAVKKFQLASDGGWLATHLTHMLVLCGKLDSTNYSNVEQSTEDQEMPFNIKFIAEYGTLLMCHHSLWQVGLCYLDQCMQHGQARQRLLLSRIVPKTDAKAMKIIQAALSRGLTDVAVSICKIEGMKYLRRMQLGKALEWAFRSQDSAFASHLADQFLQNYVKKGEFDSNDLLDNLGTCMLICDRLTFLGKYCEFRSLYSAGKLEQAAACLSALISSRIAPKYFWLTLLNDAIPLLECDKDAPFFDEIQTANLTFCLNELSSFSEGKLFSISPLQSAVFEKRISVIRLALAKNMAKAICYQTLLSN